MEKIDFFLHKLIFLVPGAFYGLFAIIIRIYCDFSAALLYPGYNPAIHMISFLGSGPGQMYFNLGLFFSSLMIIPFYISLANLLKNEFPEEEKLINGSLKVSLVSAFSITLVGFFLGITNYIPNRLLYDFHAFFAVIAFMGGTYSCYVSGSLIKKSKRFPKIFAYMFYTVAVLSVIFLVTWHASIEWISSYSSLITHLILSIYMIYNKM